MINENSDVIVGQNRTHRLGGRMLRLLTTTALVGAGIALAPQAAAQTTVTSPAGGGTITRTGGTAPSVTDQTAARGGVRIYNITDGTPLTVSGVTINQTVTGPTLNALALEGSTTGTNNVSVTFTGTNNLNTNVANGAALALTSNGTSSATINATTTLNGNYGINVIAGAAAILNAGTVKGNLYSGVNLAAGGVVTNATGANLWGGSGVGVVNFNNGGTFNNYGTTTSFGAVSAAIGVSSIAGNAFVNLYAGSSTGKVMLGSGNDVLTIYNGRGTADAATIDSSTGITLQNAGTRAAAILGTIDLGGGSNTLALAGRGDGTTANGNTGSYQLANASNLSFLNKIDSGTWFLTGTAGGSVAGATINAGSGGAPGSGGILVFNNTSGLTGTINVNGAIIRANSSTSFGTGTINAIDPTIQFSASGSYVNNIVLQSVDTTNDPTVLQIFSGANPTATLSGSITQSGATNQPLIFKSTDSSGNTAAGTFVLTGANSWLGTTTISSLTTVQGTSSSISGSSIANGGALVFQQAFAGTLNSAISGTGAITVSGLNAGNALTFAGAVTDSSGINVSDGSTITLSAANTTNNSGIVLSGNGATLNVAGTGSYVNSSAVAVRVTGASGTINNGSAGSTTTLIEGATSGIDRISNNTITVNNYGTIKGDTQRGIDGSTLAVTNYGTITGAREAINAATGGTLNNSGTITSGTGFFAVNFPAAGAATVTNDGTINGGKGVAFSGGTLTNNASGNITVGTQALSASTNATVTNAGTIKATNAGGTALSFANTGSVTNSGTVQGDNAITLLNGSITNNNGGVIRGVAAISFQGPASSTVTNNAGASIISNSGSAIVGSTVTVTNNGVISATTGNALSAAAATLTNNGTISVTSGNAFSASSGSTLINNNSISVTTGSAFSAGAGSTLTNSGTITTTGATGAIWTGGGSNLLTNTGTLTGGTTGASFASIGTVNNSGVIAGSSAVGIFAGSTLSVTNNAGATIQGGTFGIDLASGGLTLINAGTVTGSGGTAIRTTGPSVSDITLRAGSAINGAIVLGTAADTVTLYNGQGTGNGGTLASTSVGAIDFGGGNDTLFLRGSGDGTSTNGVGGTVSLNGLTRLSALKKVDAGTWTLTGAASSPTAVITAGNGTPSGTLIFNGTSGTTGAIHVNGAIVRAATAGAFGTSTIFADDPTIQFGATGTYANSIVLSVASPATADPTVLSADAGVTATLFGPISQGSGNNVNGQAIDTIQPVRIGGAGTVVLTNTSNFWRGTTTIDAGATLQGASNTISGNAIVDNGTLIYNQSIGGGVSKVISGSGSVIKQGTGTLSFDQDNSYSGGTIVSGGTLTAYTGSGFGTGNLSIASGATAQYSGPLVVHGTTISGAGTLLFSSGAISLGGNGGSVNVALSQGASIGVRSPVTLNASVGGQGIWTNNQASLDIADGASFNGGDADVIVDALTGSGSYRGGNAGQGSLTVGVAGGSGTFFGTIADTNTVGGSITGLTKAGGGIERLFGINTYTGLTTISGGGLALVGAGSIANSSVVDNATFDISGVNSPGTSIVGLSGTGNVALGNSTLTLSNANGIFSGVIAGSGGLALAGGTETLSGVNSYTGTTLISGAGSVLTLSGGSAIADAGNVQVGNGGQLTLAANETIGSLNDAFGQASAGTIALGTNTLTLGGNNGNTDFGGVISGSGGLTKVGTGTQTLSGINTYTGLTEVSAGTLSLLGGDAIADTGAVSIASGATLALQSETIDTLSGSGNVALGASTLSVGANDGSSAFAGVIDGSGGLTKLGTGTFTLSGVNTYTGLTTVSGGVVALDGGQAIADGNVVQVDAGGTLSLLASEQFGALTGAGAVSLGASTLTLGTNSSNSAYSGVASGSGGLTKVGGNTLVLLGVNTYTGLTTVSDGVLALGGGQAIADGNTVQVDAGGTLTLLASEQIGALNGAGAVSLGANTLTLGTNDLASSYIGAASGTGGLTKIGQGTLTLSGANSFSGTLLIAGGTVAYGANDVLADDSTVIVNNGTTFNLNGFSDTIGTLNLYGTLANGGLLTAANYNAYAGSTIGQSIGSGSLNVYGDTSLTAASSATPVNIYAGTLTTTGTEYIGNTAAVRIANGAGLTLGGTETIGSLSDLGGGGGTVELAGHVLAIGGDNTDASFSGVIANGIAGSGGLTKIGTGTATLTGVNTYVGSTTVSGGVLALGGGQALADSGNVQIDAGGTLSLLASEQIGALSGAGAVSLGGNTLTVGTNNLSSTYSGSASGTGGLSKVGTGTLTLSGTNSFTGTTNVTGGTLALGASNVLADSSALYIGGATADIGANTDTVASLAIDNGALNGTGTLTAANYTLTGATVNANLGSGTLVNSGGISTLNGTAGATTVGVNAGTLRMGAADRLANAAAVSVASGAVLDLGAFSDTVGTLALAGTLSGTGTLTATSYALNGATVNANLGAGTLVNAGGVSTLNGTAGATTVGVNAGTLRLGAADRLANAAAVSVASGATLDLGTFNDTVGTLALAGTLSGTGTLTATSYALNGATVNANLGSGTLANSGGVSTLNGTAGATTVGVNAGTLRLGAANRLADAAAMSVATGAVLDLGAFSDTVGTLALAGTLSGTGTLTATSYALNGATVNANLGAGTLVNAGGVSTLNGTAGATTVGVNAGTLRLGAADRLADAAAVSVASGATLDLGTFSDTVGTLVLAGTLGGTGTLTAASYALNSATVNANLGAGTLTNTGGVSTLNGTAGATTVGVNTGTLRLGAADRLADAAAVSVASGAVLDLGAFSDTVGTLTLAGTLSGTGTLTAASYVLNGATVNANLGSGTLVNSGGVSTLNGTAGATTVGVNGGTLRLGAADRLANAAAVSVVTGAVLDLGTFSDAVGTLVLTGTLNGTGTLSAASYALNGATVNANLGSGTLVNSGGVSTLNGTAGATTVGVNGGTLRLGAADRLADASAVSVASGAVLDLGTFSDTVGTLALAGTLSGTGTLTATSYALNGATVNANLGAGTLTNTGGVSTLNGTAGATTVGVNAGTLRLGAADRLANAAAVSVASGATLDLSAFSDTVGTLVLAGTLGGTGTLTAASYALNGATVNANLGAGTLVNSSGMSLLNGTAGATTVGVNAGTLRLGAADRLADAAAVSVATGAVLDLGTFSDTVGTLALAGTLNGTGTLTAASYALNGATVNANLGSDTLANSGGISTLNGTAGATTVGVNAGTLRLGAVDRLADASAVSVASGAVLDLGTFSDTVGTLALAGTLNGTGTLTAASYALNGATVNANLGSGTLANAGGISTLNGTAGATTVGVNAGTLRLGASDRLADAAAVSVASGAVLDLGTFSDTVGTLALAGTLGGTGTLTAMQYQLDGAAVNANLGTGTLFQLSGTSVLTGTATTMVVAVSGGTLRLGASDRIVDTAAVGIATGASFDLAGYNEAIGSLFGNGTLALRSGTLNVGGGNADFGFSGTVTGAGDLTKTGTGTFSLVGNQPMTGRLNVNAGTLLFAATSAGSARVQGGTLTGAGAFAGNLTLTSGTLSPGVTGQPIGAFQAGTLSVTGGNYAVGFAGSAGGYRSDQINVAGAATLSGGNVIPGALEPSVNYRVNNEYQILSAGTLSGTFGNGATFTQVGGASDLYWRLRYDLVPNAVLLEVRKVPDFTVGLTGATGNQRAVAVALNGGALTGSDAYIAGLDAIALLSNGDRLTAYDSISGEALADITSSIARAGNRFTELLHSRLTNGPGINTGDIGAVAAIIDGRGTGGAIRQAAPIVGDASMLAGNGARVNAWLQGFGASGAIDGRSGSARITDNAAGAAAGLEAQSGNLTLGLAGAVSDIEGNVRARRSRNNATLYQGGGYVAYDDGATFGNVLASYFGGHVDTSRSVFVGPTLLGQATGRAATRGYTAGAAVGHRFAVGGGMYVTPQLSGEAVRVTRDAFTEAGVGVFSLAVARDKRDLYSAIGEIRVSHKGVTAGGGVVEPYASAGVRVNFGDLDTLSALRFTGAPAGTGAFTITGARLAPVSALFTGGIAAHPSDRVSIGIEGGGTYARHEREGRVSLQLKVGF